MTTYSVIIEDINLNRYMMNLNPYTFMPGTLMVYVYADIAFTPVSCWNQATQIPTNNVLQYLLLSSILYVTSVSINPDSNLRCLNGFDIRMVRFLESLSCFWGIWPISFGKDEYSLSSLIDSKAKILKYLQAHLDYFLQTLLAYLKLMVKSLNISFKVSKRKP